MRRRYAFEAEGVSEEVKAQLEKVEDVVDEKCDTPEACNKMIDKIDSETEKFNDALKDMAGAAKDCKDGKCDKAEMAAQISPKMAELKEVAKSIGVASEGETLTEAELKDAKAYLEGAKEIVESKLDEVGGDSGSDDGDDDDNEEAEECVEAYIETLDIAIESFCLDAAMEGTNVDSVVASVKRQIQLFKGPRKEMRIAVKSGQYKIAAEKAKECASVADELLSDLNGLKDSVASAVIVNLALMIAALLVGTAVGGGIAKGHVGAQKAAKLATVTAESGKAGRDAVGAFNEAAKAGYDMMGGTAHQAGADASRNAAKKVMSDSKWKQMAKKTVAHDVSKGAGVGAAAGAAAVASIEGTSVVKFLRHRQVMNSDGTIETRKLGANDLNPLIMAMKADARLLKNHYMKLADKYSKQASGATESAGIDFDGFIAACESIIGEDYDAYARRNDAPYLFG